MEDINLFKSQMDILDEKANKLLSNIKPGELIFIIDKNLNMRSLFIYNELFFISDSIDAGLEDNYIDYSDTKVMNDLIDSLINIHESIAYKSKLIKNKKDIIDIMVDSLIINIDMLNGELLGITPLEYYNELFLFNIDGIYKISKKNNKIKKLNMTNVLEGVMLDKGASATDIINIIYNNRNRIFPVENEKIPAETNVNLNDVINKKSILVSTHISSNAIVLSQQLLFNKNIKYEENDIIDTLYRFLSIKREDNFLESMENIFDELDSKYINNTNLLN